MTHEVKIRTLAGLLALGAAGCAALGYSDRVLWRLPSPDGRTVAVCQEVPAFDGPDYDIRLERPDKTLLRSLYGIGDGDPCSEMVWSPDGRTLAVMTAHAARVRFVDVAWALDHPSTRTAYWSWREVSLSTNEQWLRGHGLRFTGPLEVELRLCPMSRGARTDVPCDDARVRRFEIPQPIVTGHPSSAAR